MSCGLGHNDIKVKRWLQTERDKARVFKELVRRTDRLAPGATIANRDSLPFDEYYTHRVSKHDFANYFINDSIRFFQIYRHCPDNRKFAIAGCYTTDKNGNIKEFEEIYITPRFKNEEIEARADLVFLNLIKTGNVKAFLGNRDFIDFPDSLNHYDKANQQWVFAHADWFK